MMNTCFNFIKPSSISKLISFTTRFSPYHNLFKTFYSQTRTNILNAHDKNYAKEEQFVFTILKKCYTKKNIEQLHAHVVKTGLTQNLFIVGKLIMFCAMSKCMDYGVSVFETVRSPDGFLWNTMIRGFGKMNEVKKVFCYYKMMVEHGEVVDNFTLSFLVKASGESGSVLLARQVHCCVVKRGFECHVHVRNTLVHMYGMLKEVRVARELFDEMSAPDLVAWNTIIDCHVCCGKYKEALDLFTCMQETGVRPDDATLVVILSACAALGALDVGRWVHLIIDQGFMIKDVSLGNSLIHMYTRCGEIQEASRIFNEMNDKNIVTYNTMILGLAAHGYVQEALDMFSFMTYKKHTPPNDVTLLGVLTACSHGGMIDEGRQYFNNLSTDHQIKPTIKHYGCMVDMLSRAGLVIEAYDLVQNMPMKCNAIVLRTLLAGCRVHGNLELAENVRRHLLEVDPDHSSDYVLLANTYASLEDWDQVSRVRRSMTDKGVQKPSPGNSLVGVS